VAFIEPGDGGENGWDTLKFRNGYRLNNTPYGILAIFNFNVCLSLSLSMHLYIFKSHRARKVGLILLTKVSTRHPPPEKIDFLTKCNQARDIFLPTKSPPSDVVLHGNLSRPKLDVYTQILRSRSVTNCKQLRLLSMGNRIRIWEELW